jgi:hypothetical protein
MSRYFFVGHDVNTQFQQHKIVKYETLQQYTSVSFFCIDVRLIYSSEHREIGNFLYYNLQ